MSDSGATASSTGSPTTSAPAAIAALRSPPKVSRRFEPGTSAGPELRRPTQAAPIASGRVPQAFEMRTRSRLPPRLTRGIIRSVWLLKAAPSAGAGAAVQVPTQWVLSAMGPPRELTGSRDYEMNPAAASRSKEEIRDERKLPGPRLSHRHPRRRFHPVRGGAVVHRGAGLARRRGGQDREPEDG